MIRKWISKFWCCIPIPNGWGCISLARGDKILKSRNNYFTWSKIETSIKMKSDSASGVFTSLLLRLHFVFVFTLLIWSVQIVIKSKLCTNICVCVFIGLINHRQQRSLSLTTTHTTLTMCLQVSFKKVKEGLTKHDKIIWRQYIVIVFRFIWQ